jgi:type I restriction enzyme R subunit
LIKLRQFGEQLAQLVAAFANVPVYPGEDQHGLLQRLKGRGALAPAIAQLFHGLREQGNAANHEVSGNTTEALRQLRNARELAIWFHRGFGGASSFQPGPFLPPAAPAQADTALRDELERLRTALSDQQKTLEQARTQLDETTRNAQQEAERAARQAEEAAYWQALALEEEDQRKNTTLALQAQQARLAELEAQAAAQPAATEEAIAAALAAASLAELDEVDTRKLIDEQLRQVGWEVDSQRLSHARGARPEKGRKLAIAEWPCAQGRADYVLFHGMTPLAIVEAKAYSVDVPGVLLQAQRYAEGFAAPAGCSPPEGSPWGNLTLPFLFATNGRPFLRQLSTRSGLWFRDVRLAANLARPLVGFYTPDGLLELSRCDVAQAHERLRQEPFEYLNLRPYQLDAIRAVEATLAQGRRTCLLAMATGTGKTRMAIGLIYRLLKARRFRRILFLVDRNALGEQALDAFLEARLENTQTFGEIFGAADLRFLGPEDASRVHVATVQSLVKRILRPESTAEIPSIDRYDCIVVDECHRGYTLDRDLSEVEQTFRDQGDYISTYRRVLDHFDACKIGLTATPALHTVEIFQPPVFWYTYRQAVLDGFLVDHEPPVRIHTELSREGVQIARGDDISVLDPQTLQERQATAPDDLDYEIEDFNRRIIVDGFNKAICDFLAEHIDPEGPGKTLLFAVNDAHADTIVFHLKNALQQRHGSLRDRAVLKITGSIDDPSRHIREFKNEELPAVVVTVDLLTTGIDVPAISTLVFLRRIRSRILFAQMLGRATRLCPDIGKNTFRVFDAIGIYDALEEASDMKPVVRRPQISVPQLVRELAEAPSDHARRSALDELIGRIRHRAPRLQDEARQGFRDAFGLDPGELASLLASQTPAEAHDWFQQHPRALQSLSERILRGELPVLYPAPDRVTRAELLFGEVDRPDYIQPADYLERLRSFLDGNRNQLTALVLVATAPRDLTRRHLRELKEQLYAAGFREAEIQAAWRETRSVDVAASLLGFLRQLALGDPLIPFSTRVQSAIDRILARQPWTDEQQKWIRRLGAALTQNGAVDRELIDEGAFRQDGGFRRLDRVFEARLSQLLGDLNEEVWKNAG